MINPAPQWWMWRHPTWHFHHVSSDASSKGEILNYEGLPSTLNDVIIRVLLCSTAQLLHMNTYTTTPSLVAVPLGKCLCAVCKWYKECKIRQIRRYRFYTSLSAVGRFTLPTYTTKKMNNLQFVVKLYFFLSPSIIAICPRTFSNRVWRSLLMACRKYIQWYISYIKLNHINWLWFLIHEVF